MDMIYLRTRIILAVGGISKSCGGFDDARRRSRGRWRGFIDARHGGRGRDGRPYGEAAASILRGVRVCWDWDGRMWF